MSVLIPRDPPFLTDRDFKSLREAVMSRADERKRQQKIRSEILMGDWSEPLARKIDAIHTSPFFATQVKRFLSVAVNLGGLLTSTLAVAYKLGVRREVADDDASEDALRKFYAQAGADLEAPQWNRISFLEGPTLVVPRVTENGAGRFVTVPPHAYDVVVDPDDPFKSPPLAAGWKLPLADHDGSPAFVIVDGLAYFWLDKNGKVINVEPHRVGMFPGVVKRAYLPTKDWWSLDKMAFVADATMLVGYFFARLNMRRKQQDGKSTSVIGSTENIPTAQALIPGEKPLIFDVASGEDVKVTVHDMNLSVGDHLAHIRFLIESTVEQFGIPQSAVTFDVAGKETTDFSLSVSHDRLTHLRADQLPFYRRSERELAVKTALVMQDSNHPLRFQVDPESILENFRTEFPELNRVGDPQQVQATEEFELSHFLADEVDLMMRRHPEMNRVQAQRALLDNLETRAAFAKELAERNLVLDVRKGMLSTPEVFGAMGGRPTSADTEEVANDDRN